MIFRKSLKLARFRKITGQKRIENVLIFLRVSECKYYIYFKFSVKY